MAYKQTFCFCGFPVLWWCREGHMWTSKGWFPLNRRAIVRGLATIFNSSLQFGIFHNTWKLVKVTPIFKLGSQTDANNYKPISVISVFSKILERIVHDQMYAYLRSSEILAINQSAFQKTLRKLRKWTRIQTGFIMILFLCFHQSWNWFILKPLFSLLLSEK